MTEHLELPETGRVVRNGIGVVAANIWERPPTGDPDGAVALRAHIMVGEGMGSEVTEGDEIAIGDETWRVEEIVEDPVNRRGHVILVRVVRQAHGGGA